MIKEEAEKAKQWLLKAYLEIKGKGYADENEKAYEFAIDALDQIGWIPVSERLPNHDEYIKNNGLFNVSDGNRSYSAWFDIYDNQRFGEPTMAGFRVDNAVTAWMPLPKSYKLQEGSNEISLVGNVENVRLKTRLDTSNGMLETCSTKWDVYTEPIEIDSSIPINVTISPEEVKDLAALMEIIDVVDLQDSDVNVETLNTEEADENGIKYLNINVLDEEVRRNPDVVRLCSDVGNLEYTKPKTGIE